MAPRPGKPARKHRSDETHGTSGFLRPETGLGIARNGGGTPPAVPARNCGARFSDGSPGHRSSTAENTALPDYSAQFPDWPESPPYKPAPARWNARSASSGPGL
ncbi:hypothetical protein GCM10027440_22310 [Nocardiopsis coralliicola]